MCCEVDFTMRKREKDEDHNAYVKAMRIQFVGNLTQLPVKFFGLTRSDIPKGLLRNPTVKNFQKFIYCAFSFCPRYFMRTAENMVLSKGLKELGIAEWIHAVDKDTIGKVTQESKDAVERLKQWQDDAKAAFEADFALQAISENDPMAKWFLEKRINKKYNDKIMLAQYQAQLAKELASKSTETAPVNVTFTMGG